MTIARDVKLAIERALKRGERINDVAHRLGVSYGTVNSIRKRLAAVRSRPPQADTRTDEEKAAALQRWQRMLDEYKLQTRTKEEEK